MSRKIGEFQGVLHSDWQQNLGQKCVWQVDLANAQLWSVRITIHAGGKHIDGRMILIITNCVHMAIAELRGEPFLWDNI
jgi:hypothetical protein